jgi:drug/metabolite transporter (DMT)-like permease
MVEKLKSDNYAYLILTLGTLSYATNHVIARAVHTEIPPVGLTFWRWLVAALILLPFVWRDLLPAFQILRTNFRIFLLLGFTMIGATAIITVALNYTSAINVSLVNTTQPLMTVLLAWIFSRETLTRVQILGLIAGTLGVVVMVSHADWIILSSLQFNRGDLLVLLAMLSFAFYAINLRKIPETLNSSLSLFIIIVSGCFLLLPFYIAETVLVRSVPINITAISSITTLALIGSLFGMLVWNKGNRIIGPARAGMFINLVPIFTAILAIIFLNEKLYLYHFVGAFLITLSIFLVLRKPKLM